DHLGGLAEAVRAVGARMFMEPNYNHPSSAYEQLLDTLKERKVELKIGEGGRNIGLGGGANLRLLWPSEPYIKGSRSDANSNSIIARLTYDQTAILFTGDAERPTEERLLSLKEDLRSNVLKVAHHGSRHTTSDDFLDKVRPEIAVISCGAGNDYGHPTREAMDRLESARAKLYRTDLDGEIVVRSDGRKVRVSTAKGGVSEPETAPVSATVGPAAPVTAKGSPGGGKTTRTAAVVNRGAGAFVGSSRSDVFHREGCSGANKIKAENLVSYKDRNDAVAAGKRPAKDCNP
ncbi:MAG: ComEC/Rec2 family competence protein, partial [Myxococcales bacterium]